MRLVRLGLRGMKAADADIGIAPVTVLWGENGAGKSACVQALSLLATGAAPGISREGTKGSSNEAIMRLARGDRMDITGLLDLDGRPVEVRRWWERSGKTISAEIEIVGVRVEGGKRERASWCARILGGFAEAWRPDDLLSASESELRVKLLRILMPAGSLKAWVPADCPEWAQPTPAQTPAEWARSALNEAKQRLSAERKELDRIRGDGGPIFATYLEVPPIEARLTELRARLKTAAERGLVAQRVAEIEQRVSTLRAQLDSGTPPPDEDAARAAVDAAEAEVRAIRDLAGRRAPIEAKREDLRRQIGRLPQGEGILEDLAAAKESGEALQEEIRALELAVVDMESQKKACGRWPERCLNPECGWDLAARGREEAGRLEHEIGEARARGRELSAKLKAAAETAQKIRGRLERQRLERELAKADADLSGVRAELDRRDEAGAAARLSEARAVLRAAQAAPRPAQLAGAEEELRRGRDALARLPDGGTAAEIEARIIEVQRELGDAREINARAKAFDLAQQTARECAAAVDALKKLVERFGSIETAILDSARGVLEERVSAVVGAKVEVQLQDARGEACRILVDGIDQATLSDGERIQFVAGMVSALGERSDAAWKPLIVDRLESVSAAHRVAFVRSISEAVKRGLVSCAVLAGCMDSVEGLEAIDGVEVVRVRGSEPRPALEVVRPEPSKPSIELMFGRAPLAAFRTEDR